MNLKSIANDYFATFSNKDITKLANFFADEIQLIDWEINASGKSAVVAANQNIFNTVDSIEVSVHEIITEGNIVMAVLLILVNKTATIKVLDVIKFDNDGKIIMVSAYKQ